MILSNKTKVGELLTEYPFLLEFLAALNPKYKLLKNPIMRKTVGNVATISQAAAIGGLKADYLLHEIAKKIEQETGKKVVFSEETDEKEHLTDPAARHEILKDIIKDLHAGVPVDQVKQRFLELIKDVDAPEISKMEEKLIEEGMPQEEVKRLCDVHVEVFKESLEKKDSPIVPQGHPVRTFMEENRASEKIMDQLETMLKELGDKLEKGKLKERQKELDGLITELLEIDRHYLRKENQLFPILEKHDISGPSQVMWGLHDDIRAMLKQCKNDLESLNAETFVSAVKKAIQTIRDMIYKEEHILYPLSLETLSKEEWQKVKTGEEEIGYAWIKAPEGRKEGVTDINNQKQGIDMDKLNLSTGNLTLEQINLVFTHLPVDISLVDENDEVAYYSDTKDRIFPRSAGVIGRKVQKCHPPKSVHVVQKILDDFREGKRDVAEFWIQLNGKFIHIRYFAVRDEKGNYKGCLEVSQDVTEIKKLEGEKRLLDSE